MDRKVGQPTDQPTDLRRTERVTNKVALPITILMTTFSGLAINILRIALLGYNNIYSITLVNGQVLCNPLQINLVLPFP